MLKVYNIFYSIQGEGPKAGRPAIFIRLAGCNYSCRWCDTKYALGLDYTEMSEETLLRKVEKYSSMYNCKYVVLTGGEPLIQNINKLVAELWKNRFEVDVETNGSIYKREIYGYINNLVVSPKPPSSGMKTDFNILSKVLRWKPLKETWLKVVVADEEDYQYAKKVHLMFPKIPFIFQLESEKTVNMEKAQWLV